MIEWKSAKNGDQIPFLEGKALASSIDPRREALSWVKRLVTSLYDDTTTIVVLGVGAGYHIEELNKQVEQNIIAIDLFEDFVFEKRSTNKLKYMYVGRPNRYWSNNSVNQFIASDAQIFMHGPSIQARKSVYFELRNEINLRTISAVKNYEKKKSDLGKKKHLELIEKDGYINLADSVKELGEADNTKEAYKWRILKEFLG